MGKIANLKSMSDRARETLMSIPHSDTTPETERLLQLFDIKLKMIIKRFEDYIEAIEGELH